ncbi:DUF2806 domain-containing protein [Leptospira gomenensis]|uniref:DUF2806 domain-containing protein n=1 Tax=Leptospira gomenensis TaxID=2484974 RepID=A0A5F1YF94_9LEPT|nr:DUF2806 domain-containing protein [Leptospira gomenensis]TGK38486.1 DUF2806 domain-containing protein [Leptospira gomenensis]TGK42601.1 DUF2806 domain-containing protein [Leptospira gomenensis]TGK55849.1 DUF2806 domain-containing protein [Leptospira gomenensis]
MNNESNMINLGEVSKPVTVLIEKISNAVGIIYEPTRIRRNARAEADALKIRATAEVEMHDIQKRAIERLIGEEVKRQENIEAIIDKAIPEIKESAEPENIDQDWLMNFFDKAKLITTEEMQSLWSKVLSSESNKPGSFSKRTVNFLSSLEKKDAELFTRLMSFSINLSPRRVFIYNEYDEEVKQCGILYSHLAHLETIGLIKYSSIGFSINIMLDSIPIPYFEKLMFMDFPTDQLRNFDLGKVVLTETGLELSRICYSIPNDTAIDYLLKKWQNMGYIIYSPYPKFL